MRQPTTQPRAALAAVAIGAAILTATPALAFAAPGAAAPPGDVRLPLDRYNQLVAEARGLSSTPAAWSRGNVVVRLPGATDSLASIQLSAALTLPASPGSRGVFLVPILPSDVVIERLAVGGSEVGLVQRDGLHFARIDQGGSLAVDLRYQAATRRSDAGRSLLILPLPPLPSSEMRVAGATPEAQIEIWPGHDFTRQGQDLVGRIPSAGAIAIRWGAADAGHTLHRIDYSLDVDSGGEGVDVRAELQFELLADEARVRLAPTTAALMSLQADQRKLSARVDGDWHVATLRGRGRHRVSLTFRLPTDRSQGQPQVELALPSAPIVHVRAEVPGKRAVEFVPAVPLSVTTRGRGKKARTIADGYLPPTERLAVRWTEPRAAPEQLVRYNTETYQLVSVQEGVLRSKVQLRYQVIRGKVKSLAITIPDDIVPFRVSGDAIEDWRTFAATADAPRQIRIFLGRELSGDYALNLELEGVIAQSEGAPLPVPVLRPLGAYREIGVVALFDGDQVAFAPAEIEGFTRVGEDALPLDLRQGLSEKVTQAFKHVGAPGTLRSAVARAPDREVRFDARVHALYEIEEGALRGSGTVLVELKSGRSDRIMLSLPEEVSVLSVTAPSLNRAEPDPDFDAGPGRRGHAVSFTQALEGAVQIEVELERLLPRDLGEVPLPDLRVHGADVEEGSLGIAAETGIEVTPKPGEELRRVDVTELPAAIRLRSPRELVLGYNYAHAPWSATLGLVRHKTVETLEASIRPARIETTVLDDGHIVTRARFAVRNQDRQFLRLELPGEAEVWSVSVSGAAVKAVRDESGTLAIPLPKEQEAWVELVYDLKSDRLGTAGGLELLAPAPDALVTDLQWLVRTPRDYRIVGLDTTLLEGDVISWDVASTQPSSAPVGIVSPGTHHAQLFTLAVHDPDDDALRVDMSYVAAPAVGGGYLLTIIAALLLMFALSRRLRSDALDRRAQGALGVGLLLLFIKVTAFGFSGAEASFVLVGLLVAAIRAARQGGQAVTS